MVHFNLIIEMYEKNLTQEKLARLLDVSSQTMHDKLYGITSFTLKEIKIIKTLFPYMTLDYLFNHVEPYKS